MFGAGYLGTAVIERALAAGARVCALTRNAARAADLAARGVEVITDDLAASSWHERVPPRPDFVLNCVGAGGGGLAGYRRSYVDGLRSILAWATGAGGGGALVYTSSTAVYPQSGGVTVDESAGLDGADERGRILREAEELASSWPGPATVLRLAGLYGPGRHHLLDTLRTGAATVAGRGDHRLNLVHRDDAVSAILAAWAQPASAAGAVFNVADDGATPKAEVVTWLARRLGRAVPEFTGVAVAGRRPDPPDRVVSNARLKARLAWTPRYPTFREGYGPLL